MQANFDAVTLAVGQILSANRPAAMGVFSGEGSPEGAITATGTKLYLRSDAPDNDNAVYFRRGASGNTGWRRFTSTGHAAA